MVSDQAVLTLAERAHDMEFHTALLGSIGSSHFNCLWNQSIFVKLQHSGWNQHLQCALIGFHFLHLCWEDRCLSYS
jgi:hypothetical protein